ncbi:MAG: bifunctional diaminohydroxyphosphoribosylaminopyrimidine deaminase/5-amino-6-(5-phosphoribosylamino)uracil reductase RibD [Deltaproteobacteria bacterium]|jgi:diaminohydroxyphosphoribosylaminopyrimidine deaminase/5-amino-6-(5-phosphoribosylamino)uracil reductase|nr:bifunctional diaminohydroxyphosphoribosylaminopyrimidine deaminase/5-amino-6-(5-phosphoribosylamino)uracil reductase RibD [Deltaproteobacteria bacterium]
MGQFTEKQNLFMRQALRLARQGWGMVSPNPMVGAVLVKRGKVIAEGWHTGPGQPHAEADAIAKAGKRAEGSELYVNLEPCAHQGRTPPCADAIIKAGISKVWYSIPDPNPRAKGGAGILRDAGLSVSQGLLEEEALELNQFYIKHTLTGIPFVVLKTAASLDGKIATSSGDSRWISSKVARNFGHHLRAGVDAVMIGRTTAEKDDPELSARPFGKRKMHREPLRVVLDPTLRLPRDLKLFDRDFGGPTLVFCAEDAPDKESKALEKLGHKVARVPRTPKGLLSLEAALAKLGKMGLQSVLIEPGATLAASALIEEKVADLVHVFIAPKFLGGQDSPSMIGGDGVANLADAPLQDIVKLGRKGPDLHLTIRPETAWTAVPLPDGTYGSKASGTMGPG